MLKENKDCKFTENVLEKHDDSLTMKKIYIISYFMIFVMLQTVNSVLNTNVPLYITETLGFGNVYVGWISSFNAIIEIPITILFVYLSQTKDIKKLICFGMFSGIVFIGLLMLIKSIYCIIFIHIIKAVFVSIFMSLGMTFFQNMIPKRYGVSTILYTNTTRVGNIISGILISVYNNKYYCSFFMLIVVCLVCLLLFMFINNNLEKEG